MKKISTSFLLLVFVFLVTNSLLADIQGNWKAVTENADKYWEISTNSLDMNKEITNNESVVSIASDEILPDSDWTIDMWLYSPSNNPLSALNLEFGTEKIDPNFTTIKIKMDVSRCIIYANQYQALKPGKSRRIASAVSENAAGGGPICWVRIINHKEEKQLSIYTNGQHMDSLKYVRTPIAPITLSISEPNTIFKVIDFKIVNKALPEANPKGPAFDGWSVKLNSSQIKDKSIQIFINDRLKAATTNSEKSYLLASKVLLEYGVNKKISNDTWNQISDFCNSLIGVDHRPIARVLPIAVKCASNEQKEIAWTWVEKMFMIPRYTWRDMKCYDGTFSKLLLLNLTDSTDLNVSSQHLVDQWTKWMMKNNKEYSILPIAFTIGLYSDKMRATAWNLPLFAECNENYYKQYLYYFSNDFAKIDFSSLKIEPDATLSFAAYRLAEAKKAEALDVWSKIKDPKIRAETLVFMIKANPTLKSSPSLLLEAENSLIKQRLEWKPTGRGSRLIDTMSALAEFYLGIGSLDMAKTAIKDI